MRLQPNDSLVLLSLIDSEGGLSTCWNFQGHITYAGYGHIRKGKRKTVKAHRWSYEHFYGDLPETALVRHTCDNRACCNPLHLALGKHKDNMQDMVLRERAIKFPVSQMKSLYKQGFNKMQISKIMGCKPETVYRKLTPKVLED
jgi:hypothetical protein